MKIIITTMMKNTTSKLTHNMKIIASTKALASAIQKALDNNTTIFHISRTEESLGFSGKILVELSIALCSGYKYDNYNGKFDAVTWYRVMEFLKQLPEQPIVLTFTNYKSNNEINDDVPIELSQFVKTF